jgi:hypothetical protein
MELKQIEPKVKGQIMGLAMEIASYQQSITQMIFMCSNSENEVIHKLEKFRDEMQKLSESMTWSKRKN